MNRAPGGMQMGRRGPLEMYPANGSIATISGRSQCQFPWEQDNEVFFFSSCGKGGGHRLRTERQIACLCFGK